ncbi:DUF7848 domain-containing protein [Streptomyces cellulosae]
MTITNAPAVRAVLKPDDFPMQQWVECVRCLEPSRDESSVAEWADRHRQLHPDHDRFRIVSQTRWRLTPSTRTP